MLWREVYRCNMKSRSICGCLKSLGSAGIFRLSCRIWFHDLKPSESEFSEIPRTSRTRHGCAIRGLKWANFTRRLLDWLSNGLDFVVSTATPDYSGLPNTTCHSGTAVSFW